MYTESITVIIGLLVSMLIVVTEIMSEADEYS